MASQKLGLDELQIVFSIKVNLLYLLYSTTFMSVFPKWDRLVGAFRQNGQKLLENYKINIFEANWCRGHGRHVNFLSSRGSPTPPTLAETLEVLPSASDKAKLFAKDFTRKSNLDNSVISIPVFLSRTNLKYFCNSAKLVKKVKTNLDFLKAYCPGRILSGGSKRLWKWNFIHTSWPVQYVSEGVLFYRLLECLMCGLCIYKCWGKLHDKNLPPC